MHVEDLQPSRAGDGASPAAAAAGVQTPASGLGTPLPERTRLVLVSTSGGESIIIYLLLIYLSIYLSIYLIIIYTLCTSRYECFGTMLSGFE